MRSKDVVTVEYDAGPEKRAGFLDAIRKYGIRRRDGAYRWGVFRDPENWERYVKTFLVVSLAEHLRLLERLTLADRNTQERVRGCNRSDRKARHRICVGEQQRFK